MVGSETWIRPLDVLSSVGTSPRFTHLFHQPETSSFPPIRKLGFPRDAPLFGAGCWESVTKRGTKCELGLYPRSQTRTSREVTSSEGISPRSGVSEAPKSEKMKSYQKLILKRWRSSGHSTQTRVLEPSSGLPGEPSQKQQNGRELKVRVKDYIAVD